MRGGGCLARTSRSACVFYACFVVGALTCTRRYFFFSFSLSSIVCCCHATGVGAVGGIGQGIVVRSTQLLHVALERQAPGSQRRGLRELRRLVHLVGAVPRARHGEKNINKRKKMRDRTYLYTVFFKTTGRAFLVPIVFFWFDNFDIFLLIFFVKKR